MKTMLNIKIDKDLKMRAQKVVDDLGLNFSLVLNNYLKTLVVEKRVDFSIGEIPNKKTAKILDKINQDIKKNKNIVGPFNDVKSLMKSLNS
jgi:addiction module RelB/DinJ family antitoxin